MANITLILPLVTKSEKCVEQFKKMLDSLKTVNGLSEHITELIITSATFMKELRKAFNESGLEKNINLTELKVENSEASYADIVNNAVMTVATEYFSVVSVNDVYSPHWIDDFINFSEEEKGLPVYLSLGINSFDEEKCFFINETAWSTGFATRHGYIDMDELLTLTPFKVVGGFINTEEFITLGKLKQGLTVATWFDYLLRVAEAEKEIFVIPRVTYITDGNETDSFTGVGNSDINDYNSGEFTKVSQPYMEAQEPKEASFKVIEGGQA